MELNLEHFFLSILLLILLGRLLGVLLSKYGFQSLIGEVLGGLILSPLILNIVVPNDTLKIFSEFGILMLMLLSGLLTDFRAFEEYKKISIVVGVMGVLFSIALIFSVLIVFNVNWVVALFISVILSNTAVEICARLLLRKNISKKTHAIIMGASFVDDIVAVFLIGLVGSLALGEKITIEGMMSTATIVIVFIAASLIFVPYFFDKFKVIDRLVGSEPQEEKILLTFSILFAILFAIVAHYSGLQEIIGAYIAGLIIGKWGSKVGPLLKRRIAYEDLVDDIEPISHALFTPLFFGYIGLQLGTIAASINITITTWIFIGTISLMAILGKFLGCGLGAKIFGVDWKTSGYIGVAMGGRGALELVLLSLGYDRGIINADLFASVVIVTLITVILTPILLHLYETYVKVSP